MNDDLKMDEPGLLSDGISKLSYDRQSNEITATRGQLTATVSADQLFLAHAGLRNLGSLAKNVSAATKATWDKSFGKWRKTEDSCGRLATVLAMAADQAALPGLSLWDTMRKGSDYWRPGKLVSDVVHRLPDRIQERTSMDRREGLCPPIELLKEFLNDEEFPFARYEQEYGQYLFQTSSSFTAACEAVFRIAGDQLPVYYCTDPFVPRYRVAATTITDAEVLADYRNLGCHRLQLVEEIVRVFGQIGVPRIHVLEPDQAGMTCHLRVKTNAATKS